MHFHLITRYLGKGKYSRIMKNDNNYIMFNIQKRLPDKYVTTTEGGIYCTRRYR